MESHMLEQSKRMKFVRMFIPAGKGCLAEEFDTLAFNIITHHLTLNPKSIQKTAHDFSSKEVRSAGSGLGRCGTPKGLVQWLFVFVFLPKDLVKGLFLKVLGLPSSVSFFCVYIIYYIIFLLCFE